MTESSRTINWNSQFRKCQRFLTVLEDSVTTRNLWHLQNWEFQLTVLEDSVTIRNLWHLYNWEFQMTVPEDSVTHSIIFLWLSTVHGPFHHPSSIDQCPLSIPTSFYHCPVSIPTSFCFEFRKWTENCYHNYVLSTLDYCIRLCNFTILLHHLEPSRTSRTFDIY